MPPGPMVVRLACPPPTHTPLASMWKATGLPHICGFGARGLLSFLHHNSCPGSRWGHFERSAIPISQVRRRRRHKGQSCCSRSQDPSWGPWNAQVAEGPSSQGESPILQVANIRYTDVDSMQGLCPRSHSQAIAHQVLRNSQASPSQRDNRA